MRRALWLALALLSGCGPAYRAASPPPPPVAVPAAEATAAGCAAGPDGEAHAAPPAKVADRGIGGTGIRPAAPAQFADRGIGGTGIIGVVTGFASLCLDGREVALDDAVPVLVDGAPASLASLRAGQLAAVEAAGGAEALSARRIAVRHEVSGPVEEVGVDGALRVAGQRVTTSARTWMAAPPALGDWVAVSGLRAPGGEIDATRIDRRVGGPVTVHGPLRLEGSRLRIGALELRLAGRLAVPPGSNVTASGRYSAGILYVEDLQPDLLLLDPQAYFGPGVSLFVVEGYAVFAGDRIRIGPTFDLRAPPGAERFAPVRAVAEFARGADGALAVTGLHEAGGSRVGGLVGHGRGRDLLGPGAFRRFEAAPTPHRGLSARGGNARREGLRGRTGFQRDGQGPREGFGADQPGNAPNGGPGFGAPGGGGGDGGGRRR